MRDDNIHLETLCQCGHRYGQHKAVPHFEPMRCKANEDSCPCRDFKQVALGPVEQACLAYEAAVRADHKESTPESFARKQEAREAYIAALSWLTPQVGQDPKATSAYNALIASKMMESSRLPDHPPVAPFPMGYTSILVAVLLLAALCLAGLVGTAVSVW